MTEQRFSTMPPHKLMPHGIPRMGLNGRRMVHQRIDRKSADDRYGAGFNGDLSRHAVKNPSRIKHQPEHFDEYFGSVDVIPGVPLFVIAEVRGVDVIEKFVSRPAETSEDVLVLVARARINLNQEGFFAVLAGSHSLRMRVGDTGGLLQEVSVEMPPYNPRKLVAEYRNSLIIAAAA